MELLTKAIESKLDRAIEKSPDDGISEKAICRFFNPITNGVWIIFGRVPHDPDILWCVADLGLPHPVRDGSIIEFGTVSLSELREIELPFKLRIERDRVFGDKGKPMEYFLNQKSLHK